MKSRGTEVSKQLPAALLLNTKAPTQCSWLRLKRAWITCEERSNAFTGEDYYLTTKCQLFRQQGSMWPLGALDPSTRRARTRLGPSALYIGLEAWNQRRCDVRTDRQAAQNYILDVWMCQKLELLRVLGRVSSWLDKYIFHPFLFRAWKWGALDTRGVEQQFASCAPGTKSQKFPPINKTL